VRSPRISLSGLHVLSDIYMPFTHVTLPRSWDGLGVESPDKSHTKSATPVYVCFCRNGAEARSDPPSKLGGARFSGDLDPTKNIVISSNIYIYDRIIVFSSLQPVQSITSHPPFPPFRTTSPLWLVSTDYGLFLDSLFS